MWGRRERRTELVGGEGRVWLRVAERDEGGVEDKVRTIWTGEVWVGVGVGRGR